MIFNLSHAIIGGVNIDSRNKLAKSVVALQMGEKQSDGTIRFYKGSGVLISDRLILTAGHNFYYLKDFKFSSAIFSISPHWGADPIGERRISIQNIRILPNFSQGSLGTQSDLAIISLSASAPSDYKPLKMQLDRKQFSQLLIAGYGRSQTSAGAPLADYRLRMILLPFRRWEFDKNSILAKFWVSSRYGSIAGGDSGGPALINFQGEYKIAGIAIHERYDICETLGTCEPQNAFTNLFSYREWILKSVRELNL